MPPTEVLVFRDADESGGVPLLEWMESLRRRNTKAFAACRERILLLERLGNELRRPYADSLGQGIHEVRKRIGRVNFRILYFFCGSHLVCLSHGFTKESEVPVKEIELAALRKRLVESDLERYTVQWEV